MRFYLPVNRQSAVTSFIPIESATVTIVPDELKVFAHN